MFFVHFKNGQVVSSHTLQSARIDAKHGPDLDQDDAHGRIWQQLSDGSMEPVHWDGSYADNAPVHIDPLTGKRVACWYA